MHCICKLVYRDSFERKCANEGRAQFWDHVAALEEVFDTPERQERHYHFTHGIRLQPEMRVFREMTATDT